MEHHALYLHTPIAANTDSTGKEKHTYSYYD